MGVGSEGDECGTGGLVSGVRGRMDSLIRSSTLSRLSSFLSPPSSTFHFLSASVYSPTPPTLKKIELRPNLDGVEESWAWNTAELAEHMMQHKVTQLSERSNAAGKNANEARRSRSNQRRWCRTQHGGA